MTKEEQIHQLHKEFIVDYLELDKQVAIDKNNLIMALAAAKKEVEEA